MCHERWALHVGIKRKFFFTFIVKITDSCHIPAYQDASWYIGNLSAGLIFDVPSKFRHKWRFSLASAVVLKGHLHFVHKQAVDMCNIGNCRNRRGEGSIRHNTDWWQLHQYRESSYVGTQCLWQHRQILAVPTNCQLRSNYCRISWCMCHQGQLAGVNLLFCKEWFS